MIQPATSPAANGTLFEESTAALSQKDVETLIKRLRAALRESRRHGRCAYAHVPGGGLLPVHIPLREAIEWSMGGGR